MGRVLAFQKRRGHVLLDVCHSGGEINSLTISKKSNEIPGIYKFTRKAKWGFVSTLKAVSAMFQKKMTSMERLHTFIDSDGVEKTIIFCILGMLYS